MKLSREFEWIGKYLAPLSEDFSGALGLKDDAAIIEPPEGYDLVTTMDAMVSGRHFLPDDPPETIGRKLLRVNVSDLAAMGAVPLAYFLTAAWPLDVDEDFIEAFCSGLAEDQGPFGMHLAGGDTVATPGPMMLSLTAIGVVEKGTALLRTGARPGDGLFVSGTIGDGGLGLIALQGKLAGLAPGPLAALAERYRIPQPRIDFGHQLRGVANACLDISDGLIQDAGHIALGSNVKITVYEDAVPVSPATDMVLSLDLCSKTDLLAAGDDYELLFTAPPDKETDVAQAAFDAGITVTKIGDVTEGTGVDVIAGDGRPLLMDKSGYSHF